MGGTFNIRVKLLTVALMASSVGFYLLQIVSDDQGQLWKRTLAGLFGAMSMSWAVLSLWITAMPISYGHGLISSYIHILIMLLMIFTRYPTVRRCKESWKNPRKFQEEYLKLILKANSATEYTKDSGLDSVTSLADLREKHPLTDYERYRPYIERLAKGEQGVLIGGPVERFALTSGTTGKSKMLPYSAAYQKHLSSWFFGIYFDVRVNAFGMGKLLQQEINLYTAPKLRYSEAGILMAPVSVITKYVRRFLVLYATPVDGFGIKDPTDSVYVHLLFGLRDPYLRGMNCNFTSNLMSAMRMVEQRWRDFVRDIEFGTVTTTNVPPEIHQVLVRGMGGGDSKRAAELKREFEKGFEGIIKRVWPQMTHVQALDSLGLKDVLLKSYVKGLPLFGGFLAATEGCFGINLWPKSQDKDEFVLMPGLCVFEFIPEDKITEDQPETLFIDELRVGGVYEVVVTQLFGVYRFRYGDVVRVRRYHYSTPVVEFMYRSGQILNVHAEKLDQQTVKKALDSAVSHWADVALEEYAVAESTLLDQLVKTDADHRPYYVVFLELNPLPEENSMINISLNKVDEEFCRHSFTYNSFREKGSIAPPLVHIVKPGTFDRLHDFILDNSTTSVNQYKVPRKLRTTATLKLMLDNSVCQSEFNANQQ